MLRLAQSLSIAAVFLAASIALAITARENSGSFQQCEKNQIQTDAPGKQEPKGLTLFFKRGAAFHCTAQFIEGHNAVITAIATVLLTFVTGGLVWTGYQQIRTTRAQLRAYVFVTSRDFTRQDDKDGKYVHHLKLINTGQTPAKMVQVVSTTRILDHPIDAKFDIQCQPIRTKA